MRKRVSALCMAVAMLLVTVVAALCDLVPVKADGGPTLKLHYNRPDGAYDGWDVWMWAEGMDGNGYAFAEEDGDMVATMEVSAGVTSVGFIVRTEDWTKDVDMDQFIDIAEVVSGTVHIYVESGVEGYTKEYGEDAVTGTKLKTAKYNGDSTITAEMTGALEGDLNSAFTVQGKDGSIAISEVKETAANTYLITLASALEDSKKYTITYDGTEQDVLMPIFYSTAKFEEDYTYEGSDLGAVWSKDKTTFKLWAPTAEKAFVNLYESGDSTSNDLKEQVPMTADEKGTWTVEKQGDLNGTYYTYTVVLDGAEVEACDPYARTTGVNGKRAMVIDLDSTDPEGWDADKNPHAGENITDAIIYELHMRDLSADASSGITNVGKYIQFTENGTKTESGIATGIDHIKDLGVTHVHMLPFYDFGSVSEIEGNKNLYNWGYDPVNYNVPEGSYSTDPSKGEVRVTEAKQMVKAMHDNGLSIVMDVVYNHVYNASQFCFNQLVPGYFSRINQNGAYSSGSGCGNDTASERSMVKKYIVDSVCYWADEYHIDGFRFDLVGLLDTETVNAIVEEVHKTYPDVIFYGEGWSMNTEMTKDGYTMATQKNSESTPGFAYFNDSIRDSLKGNVFSETEKGYVSGALGQEIFIAAAFKGASNWCHSPSQTINYASCHDNLTLFDRLTMSQPDASQEDLVRMNNLAAAVYMTSQGTPFMQAGEEMLRSKVKADGSFDSNSYSSGDEVNSIKWDNLNDETYKNVYEYYKGLIAFRKAHKALRLTTAEDVDKYVTQVTGLDSNVVAFEISGEMEGEISDGLFVVFNANNEKTTVTLPEGSWNICIDGKNAGTTATGDIQEGTVSVDPISAMVLVKGDTAPAPDGANSEGTNAGSSNGGVVTGIIIAVVVVVIAVAAFFVVKSKKKSK